MELLVFFVYAYIIYTDTIQCWYLHIKLSYIGDDTHILWIKDIFQKNKPDFIPVIIRISNKEIQTENNN